MAKKCFLYTNEQLDENDHPKEGAVGVDVNDKQAVLKFLLERADKIPLEVFEGKTETPKERKLRKLIQTGMDKGKVSPLTEEQKKDFEYDVRSKGQVYAEANLIYNSVLAEGGTIEDVETVLRGAGKEMADDTRAALSSIVYNAYLDKQAEAQGEGNLKDYEYYKKRKLEVYKYQAEQGTKAGQATNAQKWFTDVITQDPEVAVDIIQQSFDEVNKGLYKDTEVEKKADDAQKIITDYLKSDAFQSLLSEKVKEELAKEDAQINEKLAKAQAKKDTQRFIELEKKKANIKKFFDIVRDRLKGDTNTQQMALDFGISRTVLVKAVDLLEKLVLAGVDISDAVQRTKYFVNKQQKDAVEKGEIADENWSAGDFEAYFKDKLNQIQQNQKEAAQIRKQAKRLELIQQLVDFATANKSFRTNFFGDNPALAQAAIDEFVLTVDKLNKTLATMDKDKLAKLMSETIVYAAETGALDKQSFRRIFSKALGGVSLSSLQVERIQQAAGVISKAGKAFKKYQSNPNASTRAAYQKALHQAQIANRGISRMVNTGRGFIDIFIASGTGSLLSLKSIFINISSNIVYQAAVRLPKYSIASGLDFLVTAIQKDVLKSKRFSGQRTVDIIKGQEVYSQASWDGFVRSISELKTGTLSDNPQIRNYHTNLDPVAAWQRLYEGFAKKDELRWNEWVNNLFEGTFGVYGEAMFRLLNLGDKAFADSAGAALGNLLASNRNITYDELIANPEKYKWEHELMKLESDMSVFRQRNVIGDGIVKVVAWGSRQGGGTASAVKFAAYLISPFSNTPVNYLATLVKLVLPEVNLIAGVYYTGRAMDAKLSPEERWVYRRNATLAFAQFIVSMGIMAATRALFEDGLLQPPPEREKDKYKERAVEYNFGQPSTFKIGDAYVSTQSIGFFGAILDAQAKRLQIEEREKNTYKFVENPPAWETYGRSLDSRALAQIQNGLNIGVFTSFNAVLNILSGTNQEGGDANRLGKQLLDVFSSPFLPAEVKQRLKYQDEWLRNTQGDNFVQRYYNDFRNNLGLAKDLPVRRNIWGEPIKKKPYGAEGALFYLFGYRKGEPNKFGKELYDYFREDNRGDYRLFPTPPKNQIDFAPERGIEKTVTLPPALQDKYEEQVGNARMKLVAHYLLSTKFKEDKKIGYEKVVKELENKYDKGLEIGKNNFSIMYKEDLEDEYKKLK